MRHNLAELINAETNARQRLKLLAVSHFLEGKNRTEIADFLKVSRRSVNIWIKSSSVLPRIKPDRTSVELIVSTSFS